MAFKDSRYGQILSRTAGRSRLRELVLGGVTRHILAHMTIPVFLSH